jgi:ribose 5-phosphate isomerase A
MPFWEKKSSFSINLGTHIMTVKGKTEIMEEQIVLKKKAAAHAVEFVQSGMVVGLGTGSTTGYALGLIGEAIKAGRLKDIAGIPSSLQTERLANALGIPLTTFDKHTEIDLTIDGADEVDPKLNLIKGGGGALLREKVLAQVSHRNIIIVDEGKLSPRVGTHWPVPIEVIPFSWPVEFRYLTSLGAKVTLRKKKDGSPFTTDQDNFILDSDFGPVTHANELANQAGQRAGIVEHGLFLGLATDVIIAGKDGVQHLTR